MLRRCAVVAVLFWLGVASPAGAVSLMPGDILVLGTSPEVGTGIIHVDPITSAQTLIAPGGFDDFAVTPGGTLYAITGHDVVRIDPTTGTQTTVSSGGLLAPLHLFEYSDGHTTSGGSFIAANDGNVYVANQYDERVIRIDPNTGAQEIVSDGGLLGRVPYTFSHDINGTRDLALGAHNDLLVLQNEYVAPGEVIGIALATGFQTYAFLDENQNIAFGDPAGLGVIPKDVVHT